MCTNKVQFQMFEIEIQGKEWETCNLCHSTATDWIYIGDTFSEFQQSINMHLHKSGHADAH